MSNTIPESYRDLLDGPVLVSLATVMPDGRPQLSPVWCSYDGSHILINTARGRQKDKNFQERPFVSLLAVDPQNPYRYLEIRGVVETSTEEGAVAHIDELARLYAKATKYYGDFAPAERQHQETRVIYKIKPVRVIAH